MDWKGKVFTRNLACGFILVTVLGAIGGCAPQTPIAQAPAPRKSKRAPVVFTNSLGMKFVAIEGGTFEMGSDESVDSLSRAFPQYDRSRLEALGDEAPVHKVAITTDFFIGQHEVTVGQFRKFVELSGYKPESEADGTGAYGYNPNYDPATSVRKDTFEGRDPKYSWRNPGFPQGDDHPVVNVTYRDAEALAAWLTKRDRRTYRLPTEAEWEYACRAGATTRYGKGDDPQVLSKSANAFDPDSATLWPHWQQYALSQPDGFPFTAPVGKFEPNDFRVYDMHGNVWEWVSDWYGADYYEWSPAENPQGPSVGTSRVRRGGSWQTWPLYARCSYRNWNTPESRYVLLGIRLAMEAAPPELPEGEGHHH